MTRLSSALVLVLALMVQTAPICCLTVHAAPVEDVHSAAGHHSPAQESDGAFSRNASECAGTISSFTGLRVQSQPAVFEVPAVAFGGTVPIESNSFPVALILQQVDHPQRVGPPPYLPLRV